MNRNAFGQLVRSYREQRGWTQEELAERHLGWVEKTYNRLRVLPIGKEKKLDMLREALVEAQRKIEA